MPFLNRSTLTYPVTNAFPNGIWEDTRNPTSGDFRSFDIGVIWINTSAQNAWIMVDKTNTSGTWVQMASTGTGILTETGNSGGAVGPDGSNNINVIGSAPIDVAGNSGTNTLTISSNGTLATTYTEDTGNATPSAGVLKILGSGGVSTSGAGNTVTISTMPSVPTIFIEDTGSATPALNTLNVFGGTGITTSGSGATVTISVDGSVVGETITGDSGGALSPTAGNWNILGGTGCLTSGSGSTLTINVVGGGLKWTEVTVIGPTTMAVNNGYVANDAIAAVQLLLPLTAAFGSIIRVVGKGNGGWQVNQNAGQSIIRNGSSTTVGTLGTLNSSEATDTTELLCTTADTTWTIISGTGNLIFN